MADSAKQNDSRDYERDFYTILAQSWGSEPASTAEAVRQDFFDASEGIQSGFRTDGVPIVLLTLTPEGVKMLVEGVRLYQEHNCQAGVEVSLYLAHVVAETVRPLLDHLPEVADFQPFEHKSGAE